MYHEDMSSGTGNSLGGGKILPEQRVASGVPRRWEGQLQAMSPH